MYFLRIKTSARLIWRKGCVPSTLSITLFSVTGASITSSVLIYFHFFGVDHCLWIWKYFPCILLWNVTCQSFNLRSENCLSIFKGSYLEKCLYWGGWGDFSFLYLDLTLFRFTFLCLALFSITAFFFEILFHKWSFHFVLTFIDILRFMFYQCLLTTITNFF